LGKSNQLATQQSNTRTQDGAKRQHSTSLPE
jgi:hypothetical protein